jgi:serpin B
LKSKWKLCNPIQENTDNKFAFSFFSQVASQDKGNIFFSPYSISDAFSMVYEGAKGNTKDQIQSVFGFIQDDIQRKNHLKSQNEQLSSSDQYQLNTANALWAQNNYHIMSDYTDTLQNYYKSQITNLDLKNDSENSRKTINTWVENKTNQKIVDLLPPGSIDQNTRAVLTNAIYFKANWTSQFTSGDTTNQNFTTTNDTKVKVPMMSQFATFPYYEDDTVQMLDMPYQGDRLSMVVILPKDNIQSLGMLSQEKFKNWNAKLADTPVKVYMPKFTLDTKYVLNDMLSSMGIKDAFDPNTADFSGITGNHDLSISAAVHQAYVKVDEKGTEAAAATGAVFQTTSMPLYKYTFRADHPFVFMIYDKQTDLILFLGQVTNPTA